MAARSEPALQSLVAGIEARGGPTLPEEFRRLMEINHLGQVHGALAAGALALGRRGGR